MAELGPTDWTLDDYLAYEAGHIGQKPNYEWDGRQPIAMAGASERHYLTAINLQDVLSPQFRKRRCRSVLSDARVATEGGDRYRYPDLVAYCLPGSFSETVPPSLLNPILLVEVLSESTARTDAIKKLHEYAVIPGLLEYWIIDPDERSLTRFLFGSDVPKFQTYVGTDASFMSDALQVSITLSDLFADLDFQDDRK